MKSLYNKSFGMFLTSFLFVTLIFFSCNIMPASSGCFGWLWGKFDSKPDGPIMKSLLSNIDMSIKEVSEIDFPNAFRYNGKAYLLTEDIIEYTK